MCAFAYIFVQVCVRLYFCAHVFSLTFLFKYVFFYIFVHVCVRLYFCERVCLFIFCASVCSLTYLF